MAFQPVKWKSDSHKRDFSAWMHHELFNAIGDRQALDRQFADAIEQYHAPRRGSGDWPFPGSSNEEVPLTAMHAEPVIAQFMQSLHAPRNLWTAVDLSGEFTDRVNSVTEFLTILDRLYLKMRQVNRRAFPDLVILGTGVYHPTWRWERKKVQGYDEEGKVVSNVDIVNQPVCRHIPLSDFIWPANAWDIDPDAAVAPARWVAHRFRLTRNQLQAMSKGQQPWLPNFDPAITKMVLELETEGGTRRTESERDKIRELDNLVPSFDRKIDLWRIECRFDTDADGIDEDIEVIFHEPTAQILRAVHQYWQHGKRLYEVEQYIQTFSLLGKGIASMNEWSQAVMSRLLNAQVDNAILANTRMYGIPEGMNFGPDETIYPGRVIGLRPGEQVQEVKMSDIYQSLFQIAAWVQEISQERTSVNELRTGNISGLPSRTPATTVLSLLQEGNKKFDMILNNIRTGALANIGKRTLQMVAQRHQSGDTKWRQLAIDMLGADDAANVISVLDLPQTAIEEGLGIEITSTSSQVNREVEKQNLLGLIQIMQQSYSALIQAAQLSGDQQMFIQTLMASYKGYVELLSRLLEAFNIQNPEMYLPASPQQGANGQGVLQPQQGIPGVGPALGVGSPQQLGNIFGLG